MSSSRMTAWARYTTGVGLLLVLAATLLTLVAGAASKEPCADGRLSFAGQAARFCYTDAVPLYGTEELSGGRLPYLEPCSPPAPFVCDEYPVLTMYTMRLAASTSSGVSGFVHANEVLLAAAALVTATLLFRLVGTRALYFSLAPTLLLYGFLNWDLLGVALATLATVAYLRRRDVGSGLWLGLGAAAKLLPALFVIPFALDRWRQGRARDGRRIVAAALIAWLAVNVPFALFGQPGWSTFYAFSSQRTPQEGSLWGVACERMFHRYPCGNATVVNPLSLLAFVALVLIVWRAKSRREPDFPAWTFAFPILVLFLLTNKVYSPQYDLWLLPWFAIVIPDVWLFLAFEAVGVALYFVTFSFFAGLQGGHGIGIGPVQLAVLARAAVLVAYLLAYVRRPAAALAPAPEPEPDRASRSTLAAT